MLGTEGCTFPWAFGSAPVLSWVERLTLVLVWGCWEHSAPLHKLPLVLAHPSGLAESITPTVVPGGKHGEQQMLPGKSRLSPEPSSRCGWCLLSCTAPQTPAAAAVSPKPGSRVTCGVLGMFSPLLVSCSCRVCAWPRALPGVWLLPWHCRPPWCPCVCVPCPQCRCHLPQVLWGTGGSCGIAGAHLQRHDGQSTSKLSLSRNAVVWFNILRLPF